MIIEILKAFFYGIVAFFCACSLTCRNINWISRDINHKYDLYCPDSTKLVGIWKSKDGALIELNENGTCSVHNVQCIIEYTACKREEDSSTVWNYNGYWRIEPELSFYKGAKDTIGFKLHLDNRFPSKGAWDKGDCEIRLRIHNKKVSDEIVPIMLYNFIGDPDDFETYDFYKQE